MKLKRTILTFGITLAVLVALNAHAGYRSELNKWTETGRAFAFDTMEARLIWNATLLSGKMIEAQNMLMLKKKLPPLKYDLDGKTAFFIGMYTLKDLKDFSIDDSSTWKIFLIGADGSEHPASSVQQVTITPTEQVLYPYLNRWSRAFIVKFPSTDLGSSPKLIMRSVLAESTLNFKH